MYVISINIQLSRNTTYIAKENDYDLSVNIIFIRCLSFAWPLRGIIQGYARLLHPEILRNRHFFLRLYTMRYLCLCVIYRARKRF